MLAHVLPFYSIAITATHHTPPPHHNWLPALTFAQQQKRAARPLVGPRLSYPNHSHSHNMKLSQCYTGMQRAAHHHTAPVCSASCSSSTGISVAPRRWSSSSSCNSAVSPTKAAAATGTQHHQQQQHQCRRQQHVVCHGFLGTLFGGWVLELDSHYSWRCLRLRLRLCSSAPFGTSNSHEFI